jgi:hypothetical protein
LAVDPVDGDRHDDELEHRPEPLGPRAEDRQPVRVEQHVAHNSGGRSLPYGDRRENTFRWKLAVNKG